VQVPVVQKYRDLDPASIEISVRSLSEAMLNSSSTTRSKVTFCFAISSVNLGYILKYGEQYNILGKGFVWILASGTGNVEETVMDVRAIDKGDFRRLYAGFLNFDGIFLPEKIHHAVATSDYEMMQSAELYKWGAASSAGKVAASKGRSWQGEVYTLANAISGGSGSVYVYDAVWANAIGLASAKQAGDMVNLVRHIRSGGGKGSFESASGKVMFDEVGDRHVDGLTFSLQSLIPPAAADEPGFNWSSFKYSGTSCWTQIGTWKASQGFTRVTDTSVVPYWPGGMRTWAPPSDAFEAAFEHKPGPSASPAIAPPTIITVQVVKTRNLLVVVLPTVLIVMVLLVCGYSVFRISTKPRSDDGSENFEQDCNRWRQRLRLTKQDGYILSTENNMWASSKSVVIPKAQMDAAVRLSRREPFDVNSFDAFCVVLADNEYSKGNFDESQQSPTIPDLDARVVIKVQSEKDPFKRRHATVAREQLVGSEFEGHPGKDMSICQVEQVRRLKQWLLEFSSKILGELSVWSDDEHSQFAKGRAEELQGSLRSGQSDAEAPGMTRSASDPVSKRTSIESIQSVRSRDRHKKLYTYFATYVLAVRIWSDDSFALFKELKTPIQVFMNQLAGKCHARMRKLILDSDGQQLCSFVWGIDRTSSCDHSGHRGQACSDQDHIPQLQMDVRQDDAEVQAIRLHSSDVEEAKIERLMPSLRYAMKSAGLQVDADETVFITQLHRRGKLLDKMFKAAVMDALASTCSYEQPMFAGLNDSIDAFSNYQHSSPHVSTLPTTASSAALEHVTISESPNHVTFRPGGIANSLARVNGACDVEEGHTSLHGVPDFDETESEKNRDEAETWTTGEGDVVHVQIGLFSEGPRSVQVHLAPIKTQVL
jgi:hypothetical protein